MDSEKTWTEVSEKEGCLPDQEDPRVIPEWSTFGTDIRAADSGNTTRTRINLTSVCNSQLNPRRQFLST